MNFISINIVLTTFIIVALFSTFYDNHAYGLKRNIESSLNINASHVYNNELFIVPSDVTNYIILIPNEAHESMQEKHKLISDHNSYFLPKNLVITEGTLITFINADAPWDTPHPHTIFIKNIGKEKVFESSKLEYGNFTQPILLDNGNYSMGDKIYNFMKGSITVLKKDFLSDNTTSQQNQEKSLAMGGFYSPTFAVDDVTDNTGAVHPGDSLQYYVSEFNKHGLKIEDTYNFSYMECSYCNGKYWPDNKTGKHTLILYSSEKPFDMLIKDLQKLIKDNVYI